MLYRNICFKATSNWLYVWNAEATEAFCIRFLCVQTLYLIQERVFVFVAKNMFLTYIFKNTGASPKIKRDRKPVRGGNMKRRIVAVVLATVLGAVCITGCGNTQETVESTVQVSTEAQTTQAAETAATESTEDADQAAADEVAAMIDAIYVQERTENTDKQCVDAKAAWDALTDAQKELVEGENADPDYFGRDTGDASKDDPRNQEEIGTLLPRSGFVMLCGGHVPTQNHFFAQLGLPDMAVPIQYALTYPRRLPSPAGELDLCALGALTFCPPDEEAFPCLALCREALRRGGLVPAAANGANEQAVALFLEGKIGFLDIPRLVEAAMNRQAPGVVTLEAVLEADKEARAFVAGAAH